MSHQDKIFYISANDAIRNDTIAQLLEKRQNHDVLELNKALNEFRFMHQQPDARREFDLYDPDGLKKDKPARVTDDDPRCGIASLQKFDGEDLNNKARTKFQQEQLREWSEAQQREKGQAKINQEKADLLYELKMKELDQRACELDGAEKACRQAINVATKDYNLALVSCLKKLSEILKYLFCCRQETLLLPRKADPSQKKFKVQHQY